jgi:hypothetical protein
MFNPDPDSPEGKLLRQIFGDVVAPDLHALVRDTPDSPTRFACGVEPEAGKPVLRVTFQMDNVTCEGCWTELRARAKRNREERG